MTEEHLSALLLAAEAKKTDNGWSKVSEARSLTLYAAYGGASLSVSRVEAVWRDGPLLHARTIKGEVYVLSLSDVYAGAVEGPAATSRKAGFA
jgi:hypothetical protein